MTSKDFLVDTGALIRFFVADDPDHQLVTEAVARLCEAGGVACFTPQVVRESWSVLTRPREAGGFGMAPDRVALLIRAAHQELTFLPDTPNIYWRWLELVEQLHVSGRQVHDAYIAASLLEHGMTRILSLDNRDFNRYSGLSVLHPSMHND